MTPAPALLRVDNRLVHGQVLEAWVPALRIGALLVADDEAAGDRLAQAAMGLALPESVGLEVVGVAAAAVRLQAGLRPSTLVLLREVADAVRLAAALQAGPGAPTPLRRLNLGNVHFRPGRRAVAPTVYLDQTELEQLEQLARAGTEVEQRAVPTDRALSLAELRTRFGGG